MANNLKLCTEAVNAACDAVVDLADAGILRIYSGSQPATADTAIDAQVVLAELVLGTPAFGAAAEGVATAKGVATANAVTDDDAANATGTASWFRQWQANGTDELFDGSVGTSGCDLNLNTVSIVENAKVEVTSYTYTHPKAAA